MRANGFGVLCLYPHTIEILSHRGFDGYISRRTDGISRTPKKRSGEPAIWCEVEHGAALGNDFACVSADKTQLAGLPFELHDIKDDVVRVRIGRVERRHFSFHAEPAQWNCRIRPAHAQRR